MGERSLAFDPAAIPDGELIGAYRVEARLGEGATAISFRIRAAEGPPLVLKIARPEPLLLPPELTDFTRALAFATGSVGAWQVDPALVLRAEAEALERIRHPAVPRLLGGGEIGGCPYLIRELAPGETLRAPLARGARPLRELRAVALTLAELAEAGMLPCHGDIKPENILVVPGTAIALIDPAAPAAYIGPDGQPEALLATPAYNIYLELNDVTPLGVILYEILGGHNPFAGVAPDAPRRPLSAELVNSLQTQAALGRDRSSRYIPYLAPPPGSAPDERLLGIAMRAMGLAFAADGSIELRPRYSTVGEFVDELTLALNLS